MTLVAVIKDEASGRKVPFTSPFLLPQLAVLDPRLTQGLPLNITAATAMDAMTHAIEAFIGTAKNPVSDALALMAVEKIASALPQIIHDTQNKQLRLQLAEGSTLAGMAFSNSMVGLVHALGHSLGARCHLPHGLCMNLFLPTVLDYNRPEVDSELARLLLPLAGRALCCHPGPSAGGGDHHSHSHPARHLVASGQAAAHHERGWGKRSLATDRDPRFGDQRRCPAVQSQGRRP